MMLMQVHAAKTDRIRLAITRRGRPFAELAVAPAQVAAKDAELLALWRNTHREAFFSTGEVDAASTQRWLAAIAANPERILFLVQVEDKTVGHIGLTSIDPAAACAESDAWLGAGSAATPGVMLLGFARMLRWAFDDLGVRRVNARVFADNQGVLRAHTALGFERIGATSYGRRDDAGRITWAPGSGSPTRGVTEFALERIAFEHGGARML